MADIDTIVFGVFAGYLPTISEKGKGKGAFTTEHKYLPAKGIQGLDIFTKENQGILTDGSLGAVRIRGTRAWYEHSTAMRPLKQEEFKDVFKAAKDMWYRKLFGQGKMFDDEKLIDQSGSIAVVPFCQTIIQLFVHRIQFGCYKFCKLNLYN